MTKKIFAIILAMLMIMALSVPALAAENAMAEAAEETEAAGSTTSAKALAAAMCVGFAATAGAISMAIAISKTNDGISRQPEAEGSLRTSLMLGLVFIETAILYAFIIAILVIFVL